MCAYLSPDEDTVVEAGWGDALNLGALIGAALAAAFISVGVCAVFLFRHFVSAADETGDKAHLDRG